MQESSTSNVKELSDKGYIRYYCSECGRFLGLCKKDFNLNGILPYCRLCKKNVVVVKKNPKINKHFTFHN